MAHEILSTVGLLHTRIRHATAKECFEIQRELADTPGLGPYQRNALQDRIEARLREIAQAERAGLSQLKIQS